MQKLKAQKVTKENFSIMGDVIELPNLEEKKPDLEGEGFVHYGELAFMDTHGSIEFGITKFEKRDMKTKRLEHHTKTPELLLALDGDFVMPVAPMIEVEGRQIPDLSKLFAIYVERGKGVIFKDGYWHWAPFPINSSSSVLVGFSPRTWKNDVLFYDLDEDIKITI